MSLMDREPWHGRIYCDGWVDGTAGENPVIEPATGAELARAGLAGPADVTRAASLASKVQRDWAAQPYAVRAAVLRRAAEVFTQNAEDIADWLVRESGAVR